MIKLYNFDELKPEEILNRDIRAEKNVEDVVDAIIADVRARGDDALKDYALKFDGAAIENLQVTQAEIDEAFAGMDSYFLETLRQAAENIEQFHRQQVHKNFVMNDRPGIVLGQKYTPIEKAGVYVPGGTAAYPSTVLMDVIPAKVAGVSEIVMTTPAGKDGKVNPVIPECVNQCCFMVFGMDTTVTWAASEGQLQLNAFDPVIIHELLNGIELLTRAMAMFRERCVSGITINASTGRRYAEYSPSIAAALNGAIGYEHAADIAQEAANDNRTVRDVAGERTDLPASTLDELLDPIALSRRLGQTCREHQ